MDPGLKDLLNDFEKRISERLTANANKSLEHHQAHAQRLDTLTRNVSALWRKVNGSDPPPPNVNPSMAPPGKGLDDKLSSHDLDIAGIHGNLIAVDSKVGEVKTEVGEVKSEVGEVKSELGAVRGELESVRQINQKQSEKMGIGKTGSEWLFSPEGLKSVGTLVAALTGLVTAIGTFYALMTGRLPTPVSPLPSPPAMVAPDAASRP